MHQLLEVIGLIGLIALRTWSFEKRTGGLVRTSDNLVIERLKLISDYCTSSETRILTSIQLLVKLKRKERSTCNLVTFSVIQSQNIFLYTL